jgi:hypothetical protein
MGSSKKKKDESGTENFEAAAYTQRWTSNDSRFSTVKVEIPAENGNGALVSETRHEPKK